MKRVLILAVFLALWAAPAHAAGCSNTSLGNNWTCVEGIHTFSFNCYYTCTRTLAAVNAGDLLVYCYDLSETGSVAEHLSLADNAGNTWKEYPPGPQMSGIDVPNASWSCWYVLNSRAKAAGYALSVTYPNPNHADDALAQFRNSGGGSAGIDTTSGYGASGTVSLLYTSNALSSTTKTGNSYQGFNGSITTGYNGELLVAAQNMEQAPVSMSAGWTAVDADASACPVPTYPVCFFAAKSQATAGAAAFEWTDNTGGDAYFTALMAFQAPPVRTVPPYIASRGILKAPKPSVWIREAEVLSEPCRDSDIF
jgi:hypothetical protein